MWKKKDDFEMLSKDRDVMKDDGILLMSGVSCWFSRARSRRKASI
jgi:hypothetical protein